VDRRDRGIVPPLSCLLDDPFRAQIVSVVTDLDLLRTQAESASSSTDSPSWVTWPSSIAVASRSHIGANLTALAVGTCTTR